jgi:hypothetical protein
VIFAEAAASPFGGVVGVMCSVFPFH